MERGGSKIDSEREQEKWRENWKQQWEQKCHAPSIEKTILKPHNKIALILESLVRV